jgi:membrane fusion protein, multidrug efflux system
MKHKRLILLGILSFAMLPSCGKPGQADREGPPAVTVRTEVIQPIPVSDTFEVPGTIQPKIATVLSSKVMGQILSLPVSEGDRVRRGQVLVEIDGRDRAAQLRRAQAGQAEVRQALEEVEVQIRAASAAVDAVEANRELAAATLKRYTALRERRSVSPQEYDEVAARHQAAVPEVERAKQSLAAVRARRRQVLSRIDQAQAEVDASEVAVAYSRIISPIDGLITARHAQPGMLATPGMPLVAIEDDRTYRLEAVVEESGISYISMGQPARVHIDVSASDIDGRVEEITPASDPASRTYTVKLSLNLSSARPRGIRSGFFGRAFFKAGEKQTLLVPDAAVIQRGQLVGVYIVHEGAALLRLIKTGKRFNDRVEVLSGLTAGVRIVVDHEAEIFDGAKVIDQDEQEKSP